MNRINHLDFWKSAWRWFDWHQSTCCRFSPLGRLRRLGSLRESVCRGCRISLIRSG